MTDLSRFLPLSNRERVDERDVSRNWSRATSGLLLGLSAALDARPELLGSPTLRSAVSVEQALRELLTQLQSSRLQRAAARLGRSNAVAERLAALDKAALLEALHAEGLARAGATARTSVRELGAVLVLALELRAALGLPVEVDPFVSGAVALDLAVRAPAPRRAVLQARTLVAVDGEWQVGRGAELQGTAAAIVLFLAGLGGVPESTPAATTDSSPASTTEPSSGDEATTAP